MKITFLCESCRSELSASVSSDFAGRAVLCPHCRKKTRIPAVNSSTAPPPTPENVCESPNVFAKPCADFAPNPFAFSVRLETFAPRNSGEDNVSAAEAPVSKTPSVSELIATLLDEENR